MTTIVNDMSHGYPTPAPPSILIVEDEMLLALMLEDLLMDTGYRVVHADTLAIAFELVERDHFDVAILDINLEGAEVFPLAARLRELRIPFVFASASDLSRIGPEFRQYPMIAKPYTIGQVEQSLNKVLADTRADLH